MTQNKINKLRKLLDLYNIMLDSSYYPYSELQRIEGNMMGVFKTIKSCETLKIKLGLLPEQWFTIVLRSNTVHNLKYVDLIIDITDFYEKEK